MNKKTKPVVVISPWMWNNWDFLEVIIPVLKKYNKFEEANFFISKIRSGINFFEAIKLAKKFVEIEINEKEVICGRN